MRRSFARPSCGRRYASDPKPCKTASGTAMQTRSDRRQPLTGKLHRAGLRSTGTWSLASRHSQQAIHKCNRRGSRLNQAEYRLLTLGGQSRGSTFFRPGLAIHNGKPCNPIEVRRQTPLSGVLTAIMTVATTTAIKSGRGFLVLSSGYFGSTWGEFTAGMWLPRTAVSVDAFHLVLLGNNMLTEVRHRPSQEIRGPARTHR